MLGDDPPYLSVGTEVSAKYKGAFCEAKIRKVVRSVKCRVTYKQGLGTATVTDDQIKGTLRVGATVEARHADKKDFVEATITKIQDCSQYTVVFDDGDITTLRRTALCLKSGRHFAESETLDQLPLTHPEHFGNPVIGGRRGRRSRQAPDDSSEDEESPPRGSPSGSGIGGKEGIETEPEIGRVVCVELADKKKKDNWFPGLVVAPTAQDTVRIRVRDDYLVRSFKDARYYTVPKKEATEFTKDHCSKIESSTLKLAVEKALLFLEKNELPPHWDRDSLFGNTTSSGNSDTDGDLDSDDSDDEPREEKDHFVAQLYKFMDDRGTPINSCPMVGTEDLDLYRLFSLVSKLGGSNRVGNQNQWKSIARRLGLANPGNTTTQTSVKQAYKKYLHSFEDFYRKLGCTMVNHPRGSTRKQRPGRSLIRDKDRNTPVPLKSEHEHDDKKIPTDEQYEKKIIVDEPEKNKDVISKKKDEEQSSPSGPESDINIEAEESSSSEKSHKPARFTPIPNRNVKSINKNKDETKKISKEKKKTDLIASSGSSTSSQSSSSANVIKKEKNKEEETAKTRSKAKDDKKDKDGTRENRETSTEKSSKAGSTKQRRMTDDDLKKQRGRKKKEDTEKSREKDDNSGTESSSAPCYKGPVQMGDRLKVYYGPTHESKVTYEAKVIGIQRIDDSDELNYFVHYAGWNSRYDEWIKATRIAQNFTQQQGRVKRAKGTPRPQTPSATTAPKTSKTSSSTAQNARRRAQSVAPTSSKNSSSCSSASTSSNSANNAASKEKEPARSTTPLSVASSSSRTKSPATPASRPTRNAARNTENSGIELRTRRTRRVSGHTDLSVVTESEESDDRESDDTEPERARTRSRGTEERRRREIRRRVEDRIKPDDNSEGEDDKDVNEELPRRTRRLRRAVKKTQSAKEQAGSGNGLFNDETDEPEDNDDDNDLDDEPEESEPLAEPSEKSANAEEAPKGRDFDLNQIRSELKGFDKAVKMEVMRVEAEADGGEDVKPKIEELDKEIKQESKEIVKIEESEPEPAPILEEVIAPTSTSPAPTTEDVYEFKEPEPFEFEVRNKRDSGGDKEKIGLKKRVFDEEPKSPKKKQKIAPPTPTKTESHPVLQTSSAPPIPIESDVTAKKKPKRLPVIKRPEETDATIESVIKTVPKECVDKPADKSIPEDLPKLIPSTDPAFTEVIAEESIDDSEDRLVISETEVLEVEEKKTFPVYSAEPKKDLPVQAAPPKITPGPSKLSAKATEEKKEAPTLSVINVANPVTLPSNKEKDEQKSVNPPNYAQTIILATNPTSVTSALTVTSAIERKLLEAKMPAGVGLPVTLVPAPLSARLPATASIEEKLSMAFRQQKSKDTKRDDEPEVKRSAPKKTETMKKKQAAEAAEHSKSLKNDDKKKESLKDEKKDENSEKIDIRLTSSKVKDDDSEKTYEKFRKDPETKKSSESKMNEHRRIMEKRQIDPLKEIVEATELEKQKNRKKAISQEFLESTDSSDSDQKLVIDNPEEKVTEKLIKVEKIESSLASEVKIKPATPEVQGLPEIEQKQPMVIKNEEEGENMNLLCEEEIPGSPAPPMDIAETDEGTANQNKEKIDKKMVILEMPFASAPTSGAQSTSQGALAMTVASSCAAQAHAVVKQIAQVVAPGGGAIQVVPVRRDSNEAATVMENTPPTTPDSEISNISNSPRAEERAADISSPGSDDNKPQEADDEVKGNFDGHEESTIESSLEKPTGIKRQLEELGTPKKRKRNRKSSECGKEKKMATRVSGRITRQGAGAGSDSDDTSEGSNAGGSSSAAGGNLNDSLGNGCTDALMRDHKPLKYNFFVELDPALDGNQRINVLQQKLAELKKTYNVVKAELAVIERRRKKLRRREREAKKMSIAAMKAAKAEMSQSCG